MVLLGLVPLHGETRESNKNANSGTFVSNRAGDCKFVAWDFLSHLFSEITIGASLYSTASTSNNVYPIHYISICCIRVGCS